MAVNDLIVSQVSQVPANSQPIDRSNSSATDISTQIDEEIKNSIEFQILTRVVSSNNTTKSVNAISKTESVTSSVPNKQFVDFQTIHSEIQIGQTNSIQINNTNSPPEFSQMIMQERESLRISSQQEQVQQSDPLAFDLDGNGLQTTGIKNGVNFDINADGTTDKTSFVSGNDAFLALDGNNNGRIDSGKELFGDQNGAANGYDELSKHDSNKDNIIDDKDPVFERLRLFRIDNSGNQVLSTLNDSGIKSIALGYQNSQKAINQYDTVTQEGSFERKDGSTGATGDIMLGFSKKV